jgi:hypothetical protein
MCEKDKGAFEYGLCQQGARTVKTISVSRTDHLIEVAMTLAK